MKIADLPKVVRLGHARAKLVNQIDSVECCNGLCVTIDNVDQDDSIVDPVKPLVLKLLRGKLSDIDSKLADYGVEP